MKQVITNFGYFLLEGTALLLLMLLLFHQMTETGSDESIFSAVGSHLQIEHINYSQYKDFKETFVLESEKTQPAVFYQGGHLTTGTACLTDVIHARDYAGNALPIQISSIKNMHGIELIESFSPDTANITLSESGIYTISVSAIDDGNRLTTCTITVPVNN